MTDLEALVVAAYVFADEYRVPSRGGRRPLISDAELVALAVAQRGLPLGYTIVPANEKEYEPLADLLTGTPAEVVIADKASGARLRPPARRERDDAAHTRQGTHRGQRATRARARFHPPRDRERLLEPERTDAARAPPRPHTGRPRRPDRATHPHAHPWHPAQHPQRPPRTRPRRLRRPLNHLKPLAPAGRTETRSSLGFVLVHIPKGRKLRVRVHTLKALQ